MSSSARLIHLKSLLEGGERSVSSWNWVTIEWHIRQAPWLILRRPLTHHVSPLLAQSLSMVVNRFSCAHYTKKTQHTTSNPNKMKSWWQQQKQKFARFFFVNFAISSGTRTQTHTRSAREAYTSLGIGFYIFLGGRRSNWLSREISFRRLRMSLSRSHRKGSPNPASRKKCSRTSSGFSVRQTIMFVYFFSFFFRLFEKF